MRVNGCKTCKHYNVNTCKCRAFPNGIPEDIRFGKTFHSIEIEGDNGYRYEPDENGFFFLMSELSKEEFAKHMEESDRRYYEEWIRPLQS